MMKYATVVLLAVALCSVLANAYVQVYGVNPDVYQEFYQRVHQPNHGQFGGYPQQGGFPQHGVFQNCYQPTCYDQGYTGFGCDQGNCAYVCQNDQCYNQVAPGMMQPVPMQPFTQPWGYGALQQYGCNGGNCGYWDGCSSNGYCGGHYDFRNCGTNTCQYGPFTGYGCRSGVCRIVCYIDLCHDVGMYGQSPSVSVSVNGSGSGSGSGNGSGSANGNGSSSGSGSGAPQEEVVNDEEISTEAS